jgi:hypothetical protein
VLFSCEGANTYAVGIQTTNSSMNRDSPNLYTQVYGGAANTWVGGQVTNVVHLASTTTLYLNIQQTLAGYLFYKESMIKATKLC